MNEITNSEKSWQGPEDFTILDRSQDAPVLRALSELVKTVDDVTDRLLKPQQPYPPALVLPFISEEENSAEQLVRLVQGRLDNHGKATRLIRPTSLLHLPEITGYDCVIIHHAPQISVVSALLEELHQSGVPVLVTGNRQELQRLHIEAETRWLPPFDKQGGENRLREMLRHILAGFDQEFSRRLYELILQFSTQNVRKAPEQTLAAILAKPVPEVKKLVDELRLHAEQDLEIKLWRMVCAADAWGVCLPFELLTEAAAVDQNQAGSLVEKAYHRELLFWNERNRPPALTVSSGGVRLARHLLAPLGLVPGDIHDQYRKIFQAVESVEPSDRHAAMQLIRNLSIAPARRQQMLGKHGGINSLRELIRETCGWLWQEDDLQLDSLEILAWTGLLRDIGLFAEGHTVVDTGLKSWPEDIRLYHAKAYLLAGWSMTEPEKVDEADRAFQKAYEQNRDNPYILLARALFAKTCGQVDYAQRTLDTVLENHPDNPVILAALIDLTLDRGKWQKAGELIKKGITLQPDNIRLLHLAARHKFYLGETEQAEQLLAKIEHIDRYNLYACSTRVEIALAKEDEATAEKYLAQGLAFDPENVALLNARSNLLIRRGKMLCKDGRIPEGVEKLQQSEEVYHAITMIEGGESSHTLVGKVNIRLLLSEYREDKSTKRQDLDRAEQRLERLYGRLRNQARVFHLRGRLEELRGNVGEAKEFYEQILDSEQNNCHALVSLAKLANKQGRHEEGKVHMNRLKRIIESDLSAKMTALERQDLKQWIDRLDS